MLEVIKLSVKRGNTYCLDGVTAQFPGGQLTALIGPNGAGKSSLIKAISGEWPTLSGTVKIGGTAFDTWHTKERAKVVAVMAQHPQIAFDFTVKELVLLGRSPHRAASSAKIDETIIEQSLQLVGLSGFSRRSTLTLSGGELQRVFLAKAIAQITQKPGEYPAENTLLLLDEPTSALDMAQQITAMSAIKAITKNGGTVVAVMHDLNLVASFADYVLMMRNGQLVESGSPDEVLQTEKLKACYGCKLFVDHRACDGKRLISVGGA